MPTFKRALHNRAISLANLFDEAYQPIPNTRPAQHTTRFVDLAWDTANSRYRRIFNDRTGLASARNQRPFLLQTYRRDMGGGTFIVMKEAAAPITVQGRHWGGVRLAFKF